ncbi:MAG: hypothetical protein ACRD6N_16735 [Pyrinomonadaceae bacterium]
MIELPAKVPPNSYVPGVEGLHLQKWLVLRALDQRESPPCRDVDALTHASFSFVRTPDKPPNAALQRLAHSTHQRSRVAASPLQALIGGDQLKLTRW